MENTRSCFIDIHINDQPLRQEIFFAMGTSSGTSPNTKKSSFSHSIIKDMVFKLIFMKFWANDCG